MSVGASFAPTAASPLQDQAGEEARFPHPRLQGRVEAVACAVDFEPGSGRRLTQAVVRDRMLVAEGGQGLRELVDPRLIDRRSIGRHFGRSGWQLEDRNQTLLSGDVFERFTRVRDGVLHLHIRLRADYPGRQRLRGAEQQASRRATALDAAAGRRLEAFAQGFGQSEEARPASPYSGDNGVVGVVAARRPQYDSAGPVGFDLGAHAGGHVSGRRYLDAVAQPDSAGDAARKLRLQQLRQRPRGPGVRPGHAARTEQHDGARLSRHREKCTGRHRRDDWPASGDEATAAARPN